MTFGLHWLDGHGWRRGYFSQERFHIGKDQFLDTVDSGIFHEFAHITGRARHVILQRFQRNVFPDFLTICKTIGNGFFLAVDFNLDAVYCMFFHASGILFCRPEKRFDGRVLISTSGNVIVPGVPAGLDEDILAFTPTTLGDVTSGIWAMYFDGSDVGLADSSNEDINAFDVRPNGDIYLTTTVDFAVTGISGFDEDVFICTPTSLGDITACTYSPLLYFDGSTWGLDLNDVDSLDLP